MDHTSVRGETFKVSSLKNSYKWIQILWILINIIFINADITLSNEEKN